MPMQRLNFFLQVSFALNASELALFWSGVTAVSSKVVFYQSIAT
jgi:hypothetical protein